MLNVLLIKCFILSWLCFFFCWTLLVYECWSLLAFKKCFCRTHCAVSRLSVLLNFLFQYNFVITHIFIHLGEIVNAQNFEAINTIPNLPDNTLATNYAGLQLNYVFDGSRYDVCRWALENRDDNIRIDELQIYSLPRLPCGNRNSGVLDVRSTCSNDQSIVNSTLNVLIRLNYNFSVYVECAADIIDNFVNMVLNDFYVKGKNNTASDLRQPVNVFDLLIVLQYQ